jgi:hypothetical protein
VITFKAVHRLRQFIVSEKGEPLGGEYDYVSVPHDIHGKVIFWARYAGRFFVADADGKRTRREYDEMYHLKPLAAGRAYVIARRSHTLIKETFDIHRDLVYVTGIAQ